MHLKRLLSPVLGHSSIIVFRSFAQAHAIWHQRETAHLSRINFESSHFASLLWSGNSRCRSDRHVCLCSCGGISLASPALTNGLWLSLTLLLCLYRSTFLFIYLVRINTKKYNLFVLSLTKCSSGPDLQLHGKMTQTGLGVERNDLDERKLFHRLKSKVITKSILRNKTLSQIEMDFWPESNAVKLTLTEWIFWPQQYWITIAASGVLPLVVVVVATIYLNFK